ncbi:MAG: KOW domain-containing RNA-binding protein [Clostridia bacterium]|nr:RNA-binding protein [Oscillospiraceae bacterium]MBQ2828304.1 KOW domain-containing RNA-binding protein [Clostridia bacterium]
MEIEVGRVVRSKAGHDSNDIFAVVGSDENHVFIIDGKERRVEKPKRKNPKHIELTSYMLSPEEMAANGRLKKALGRIRAEADK